MNREIIEEMATLYALGTLPEAEMESFETLIRSDRSVQQLVHECQRLNEFDARDGDMVEPPFQSYSRIMSRIDEAVAPKVEAPVAAPAKSRIVPFLAWSGWGLAACAAIALGVSIFGGKPAGSANADIVLNNLANPRVVAVKPPSENVSLEDRMLELSGLAEAYWFSREGIPEDQRIASSDADRPGPALSGGFTIFDKAYQMGYIAVENLPREQAGKSYHVWAKTRDGTRTVRAGALPIGSESRGLFFFDLSGLPNVKSLDEVTFFVTEESTDEPEKPGPMVVLSQY